MGKPAARITDFHACPMVTPGLPPIPHVGGPIIMGSPTVFTGKLPQARVGDQAVCVGPPDVIVMGSTGVFVNKMPAARMGDQTAHGGMIAVGLPTVLIGEMGGGAGGGGGSGGGLGLGGLNAGGAEMVALAYANFTQQVATLVAAAEQGAPFCEICLQQAAKQLGDSLAGG